MAFSGLVAGVAAALTGADANQITIASSAGSNAAANNYLAHAGSIRNPATRDAILRTGNCPGVASCQSAVAGLDGQIALLSDDGIARMCGSNATCVSDRTLERDTYRQARDAAMSRLDPNSTATYLINTLPNGQYTPAQVAGAVTRLQNGAGDSSNPVDVFVRDSINPITYAALLGVTVIDGDGGRSAPRLNTEGATRFVSGATVVDRQTGTVYRGNVDLQPTFDRINAGQQYANPITGRLHNNDGAVFENRMPRGASEPALPVQPANYYREWVVGTPGLTTVGPQRLVTGQGGEIYYTPNHYTTFIRVR